MNRRLALLTRIMESRPLNLNGYLDNAALAWLVTNGYVRLSTTLKGRTWIKQPTVEETQEMEVVK